MMRELPAKDFLSLFTQVFIPKQLQSDSTNTLRLVIEGFAPNKAIQGQVIRELDAHNDDDASIE